MCAEEIPMRELRSLLFAALVGLALGGFFLHYRIHPHDKSLTMFWASFFALIDLLVVSALFVSKRYAVWGVLLNGFIAFIGIIMMADMSVATTIGWGRFPTSPLTWFVNSLFPDIAILFADFAVGVALYRVTVSQPR
jgi:hypothetical protein